MIENSKDILNLLLGFSTVWLVLWLSYLLFQLSKTLRLINKTVEGVEFAIEGFNNLIEKLRKKLNSTSTYFTVLLKSGQKILEMIHDKKSPKTSTRKKTRKTKK